jgi:hypothetical protein
MEAGEAGRVVMALTVAALTTMVIRSIVEPSRALEF